MTAGTILLWRHGQTEWNDAGRMQGQTDVPLDATGRAQAQAAAEVLARVRPAAIVTSDLARAAVTAQALGDLTGTEVTPDERLRESGFGQWEGLTRAEMKAHWPDEFNRWVGGERVSGLGIEARGDVGARVAQAVNDHAARLQADDTLVVATHGGAISMGLAALLGHDANTWNGISGIGNCHWSVLHAMRHGAPNWRLAAHNVGAGDPIFQ